MAIGTDILILGPVAFDNFSPPERMPFGGRQSMAVHKYVGGSRVIDTTGPDDMDISWSGFFWDPNAMGIAQTIDALRIAGNPLPLSWGGLSYTVVIADASFEVRRFPNVVDYHITCVVATDGAQGDLTSFSASANDLVAADIGTAQAATNLPANVAADVAKFATAFNAATPISSAPSALVNTAAIAANTALNDVVAAIPGLAGGLDAPVVTGRPPDIAAGVTGLLTSALAQSALVDLQGVLGRAITNLAQAGI